MKFTSKIIEEGKEITDHHGIKRAFFKYYTKLFQKQQINKQVIEKYLEKN